MKSIGPFSIAIFILCQNTALAYVPSMGGSGGGGACAKPKFSHFEPGEKAEVKPGAEFSFMASANTHPNSIKVEAKGLPVDITTSTKAENAFKVTGKLPDSLKNTFVRIAASGQGASQCKGSEGWLVKVTE